MNILKFLGTMLLVMLGENLFASDKLTKEQLNYLSSYVYENIVNENYIKTHRVTRGGVLNGCELEFYYAYQDYRSLVDGVIPVVRASGSFAASYFNEKHLLIFSLKIVPVRINFETMLWDTLYPTYSDIIINGKSIEKYRYTDFKCEIGGRCSAYSDNNQFKILDSVMQKVPFDGEIKLSLTEGGMDTSFKISSIASNDASLKERESFTNCTFELVGLVKSDLEKLVDDEQKK